MCLESAHQARVEWVRLRSQPSLQLEISGMSFSDIIWLRLKVSTMRTLRRIFLSIFILVAISQWCLGMYFRAAVRQHPNMIKEQFTRCKFKGAWCISLVLNRTATMTGPLTLGSFVACPSYFTRCWLSGNGPKDERHRSHRRLELLEIIRLPPRGRPCRGHVALLYRLT